MNEVQYFGGEGHPWSTNYESVCVKTFAYVFCFALYLYDILVLCNKTIKNTWQNIWIYVKV